MQLKKRTGFTLIELLVVMAILGVLATIAAASFRTAQIKGRDAKRKHDIAQIQKALEIYYNDYARYPATTDFPSGGSSWVVSGYVYLQEVPADPKYGDYVYNTDTDGTIHYLYARLENENDACFTTNPNSCDWAGFGGTDCGDEACNYKLTSPNVSL